MSELDNLQVSVALCTYNGEKYICDQLNSIINQTRKVDEIILSDDNSTDNTLGLAESILTESGIAFTIIKNKSSVGVTLNFKMAIDRCIGDIIVLSDQDDVWEKNKIEELLIAFQDEEVIMAFSDASAIDKNGKTIIESWHKRIGFMQSAWTEKNWIDAMLRKGHCPNGCLMAFRRKLYLSAPDIWSGEYMYHDRWLCYSAGLFGEYYYNDKPLIRYRIHEQSITQGSNGQASWYRFTSDIDDFDKYFEINVFRQNRVEILRKVSQLSNIKNKKYLSEYKKCIRMYDRLVKIKNEDNKILNILILFRSLIDGSFYYRNTNRNQMNPIGRQLRILISDIIYLLRR